jgi:hypothetical protein
MDNVRIRCPKCEWEPDGNPYWRCDCGFHWNTFATSGRCPQCRKVHEYTQCPSRPGGCSVWSPHLDWYEGLDDIVSALKESIKESWQQVMA